MQFSHLLVFSLNADHWFVQCTAPLDRGGGSLKQLIFAASPPPSKAYTFFLIWWHLVAFTDHYTHFYTRL